MLVREQVERTLRGIVTVQKLYRGHRCHYRYRVRLVTLLVLKQPCRTAERWKTFCPLPPLQPYTTVPYPGSPF